MTPTNATTLEKLCARVITGRNPYDASRLAYLMRFTARMNYGESYEFAARCAGREFSRAEWDEIMREADDYDDSH